MRRHFRGGAKFFLIVVAIIAVLVAIAVPLFTGALDKSKEEVFNANRRALKSAAISAILTGDAAYIPTDAKVTGTFNDEGDITAIEWDKAGATVTTFDAWKKDNTTITIEIEKVELTAPTAPTAP